MNTKIGSVKIETNKMNNVTVIIERSKLIFKNYCIS